MSFSTTPGDVRSASSLSRRRLVAASGILAAAALLVARPSLSGGLQAGAAGDKDASGEAPLPASFAKRGRLVDLAAEMERLHGAKVPPVHDPLWGLRVEDDAVLGRASAVVLLRTPIAEGLFVDKRFREHVLEVEGRVFPGTAILEVTRYRWLRDGRLFDVYYWCEICAIRGHDPHTCACCQAPVELREAPVEAPARPGG